MGLADDEVALDEAEQEMFRHLQDLDSHLGQEDGEHEQEIGKTFAGFRQSSGAGGWRTRAGDR